MPLLKLATESTGFDLTNTAPTHVENIPRKARADRDISGSHPSGCLLSPSAPRRKMSTYLGAGNAADVLAALKHAVHLGLTPNRHVTINWETAGVSDPIAATGKFLKLMQDGIRRQRKGRGKSMAYIWVREVGIQVGEHVHILLHVPPALSTWFARRKPGWLKKCGAKRGEGVSLTRAIRGHGIPYELGTPLPDLYRLNLDRVTDYLLKHGSQEVQECLGIAGAGPCSLIGKRVSISQNILRRARTNCSICGPLSGDAEDTNSAVDYDTIDFPELPFGHPLMGRT